MKTMQGWKVITKNRYSINGSNSKTSLYYRINVETFPKMPNSKLFFFDDKKTAEGYACNYNGLAVPCIATNPHKLKKMSRDESFDEKFWRLRKSHKKDRNGVYGTPPNGTYVADSITCLE